MPDVDISCVQCRENFVFSEKDQELFYQRNMMAPQRCPRCRSKKAAASTEPGSRFEIVCDNCGRHDTVPFQPKVGRSVLCKDCHEASRSRGRAV
jgi:CxxC-x17-CxxC domain-containing protein